VSYVRSTVDAAIIYQAMTGREPLKIDTSLSTSNGMFREIARDVKGLVRSVITETERTVVDANILGLYDDAVAWLRKWALVKPLTFPRSLEDMRISVATVIGVEGYYYYQDMY
jgi:Asp-tRNA(Asn)/Glu-tRNA(Gln) amidotransferase A subunit family amidase